MANPDAPAPRPFRSVLLQTVLSVALTLAAVGLAAPYLLPRLIETGGPVAAVDEGDLLDLEQVILGLREDFQAVQSGVIESGEGLMFEVDYVDVELSVVVTRSAEIAAKGGLPEVLVISDSASAGREGAQKIRVRMTMYEPGAAEVTVIDGPPPLGGVGITELE